MSVCSAAALVGTIRAPFDSISPYAPYRVKLNG